MENAEKKDCLNVEVVELTPRVKQNCLNHSTNLNKLNKLNNIYKLNKLNNTSILRSPETKVEELFFFLYDNGESTPEQIEKGTEIPLRTLYTYKTREKENIISKRGNSGATYDISQELREKIDLRIKQKQESEKKKIEAIAHEKEIQRTEEELVNEIKELLEDKTLFQSEGGFIWLDLKELQETNTEVFNRFIEQPEQTLELFRAGLTEKGFNKILRFRNFSEVVSSKKIESKRASDIDRLLLFEARSSNLSDVRPQITNIKYECPSCGTIISVIQIEKKIKEPNRCSCGRRGNFKELSRDLVDRARVELEDLTDLTESPQTASIDAYLKEHLTESKELSKITPGNEVKVLAILRAVERIIGGAKATAMEWFLDVLEVEPFEPTVDLSSFSDEEIEEYKNISRIIQEDNKLDEIRESFAPDIIGNENPKDMLLLKGGQGKGGQNKSDILFVSNPGVSKSRLVKRYKKIVPGTSYVSGSGSSAVGLTATVEKKDEGWVLKPGVLPKTPEDTIIDEFNLLNDEEKPKLQEAMSEDEISIDKAGIHAKLKCPCGVTACANPMNGVFIEGFDIVKQFNIPPQILNRFDAVFIIQDSKDAETDKKISRQMLRRENNQIKQKYSDDKLKRFLIYARNQKEPKFGEHLTEEYIPNKYAEIRDGYRTSNKVVLNPRFNEAIIRISKAMAKLKLQSEVSEKDVDFAIALLKKTYLFDDFINKSEEKVYGR